MQWQAVTTVVTVMHCQAVPSTTAMRLIVNTIVHSVQCVHSAQCAVHCFGLTGCAGICMHTGHRSMWYTDQSNQIEANACEGEIHLKIEGTRDTLVDSELHMWDTDGGFHASPLASPSKAQWYTVPLPPMLQGSDSHSSCSTVQHSSQQWSTVSSKQNCTKAGVATAPLPAE